MNLISVERQFDRMGVSFRIAELNDRARSGRRFSLDVRDAAHEPYYEFGVSPQAAGAIELQVLQALPRDRHLVLMVRHGRTAAARERFLCGHDERHWFVAAVPQAVSTVSDAMEALKPAAVRAAQVRAGLSVKERRSRHNEVYYRQGEWFFLPEERLAVDAKMILHNEPISRGSGSKAHVLEEAWRTGGERVMVCGPYPRGLTEAEHRRLLKREPGAVHWGWVAMNRNAGVFARGRVRHPDHATITLHGWHRVLMNRETEAPAMKHVAFLD